MKIYEMMIREESGVVWAFADSVEQAAWFYYQWLSAHGYVHELINEAMRGARVTLIPEHQYHTLRFFIDGDGPFDGYDIMKIVSEEKDLNHEDRLFYEDTDET